MKVLGILSFVLLFCFVSSKSATLDRFDKGYPKSVSQTPVKLNDASYREYTSSPRDYSIVVLLTALDSRFACALCQSFQPEWNLLAKSWMKGDKAKQTRLIFGTLDFIDGKMTFQSLGLQTAPVVLLFKPTIGEDAKPDGQPIRYDFTTGSQPAELVHAWIARHLKSGQAPAFVRPFNYVRLVIAVTTIAGLITGATVAAPYALPIIQNRNLWAALSLLAILAFTSGHMFNQIRKVPYVAGNGRGGISYFAGGFQSQFGIESQIVAGIYAVLAFATISLAIKVPEIADLKKQQFAVFLWSGIMLLTYSFLLSIFRMKNGGYPFWLPPL